MSLNLRKPLVLFDLETTGINVVTDRIVEISVIRVEPNNKETEKTFRVNPGIPIPAEATAIHGISDEDVKDSPSFSQLASTIIKMFEGADIAGFNSNKFDIPLIAEEFLRANVDFDLKNHNLVDVQVIFHKMEQRNLTAAYKFYCGKDLTDAHSSKADIRATYEVLQAQLDKYTDLPKDISELSKFASHNQNVDLAGHIIKNDAGVEIFNFGKYKGISVSEVLKREPGYFSWILNGQFPLYTKKVLTAIRLKERLT